MNVSLGVGVTDTFLSHWDSESDRDISKYWVYFVSYVDLKADAL